jgi:transposase
VEAIDDELVGQVVLAVRPGRRAGHGDVWAALEARREWLCARVEGIDPVTGEKGRGLTAVKIAELLARQGCVAPYRTVHRFLTERCGYQGRKRMGSVRVDDCEPGVELQVDFGYMGLLGDPETGKRRKVYALVLTAVFSRHMFVYLTHRQTVAEVIAGCEAAWAFFGGVFRVLIPDNLTPVVPKADKLGAGLSVAWLDYAQHAGFHTDPARIRSPQDKPRVERAVSFVKHSFWDGEHFTSLSHAQAKAEQWCAGRAGLRVHGTTQAHPAEVFAQIEAPALLGRAGPYDPPIFCDVKVHPDLHVSVAKALYSVPAHLRGQTLQARADSHLVKLYRKGVLVKTHPRMAPGRRSTDVADVPADKAAYAMRDTKSLIRRAHTADPAIGAYAERVLDTPLPWTKMRQVHALLALAAKYGPGPVAEACRTASDLDVLDVRKIRAMVEKATEATTPALPADGRQGGRFASPASDFTTGPTQLTLIVGGKHPHINEEMTP